MDRQEEVLIALRRIIRATDLHSKRLGRSTGLTTPQLLVLQTVNKIPFATVNEVAKSISLSQATVSTILDRLEAKGLITRQRNDQDKRKVNLILTEQAEQVVSGAPLPFQEAFSKRFDHLEEWEQHFILAALTKVASMMDAEDLDASPFLDVGPLS
ncbi:MarR family winged helix-turn-helix transcriptional regulator [Salinibius halmophilus]|uniref:MarR family winged helix-turn-helix transcriptional regulator n=1 Tax=Salinibius halmophilus TaxID=1853216 RepID=UPI000E674F6E|nr:MarR family transcriptional regulator [Salinibius halmophilus]